LNGTKTIKEQTEIMAAAIDKILAESR